MPSRAEKTATTATSTWIVLRGSQCSQLAVASCFCHNIISYNCTWRKQTWCQISWNLKTDWKYPMSKNVDLKSERSRWPTRLPVAEVWLYLVVWCDISRFAALLRDFLFIYLSFINAEDEMSPLHRIIVMPVGLFLVWPLFYGGGLAASRPHSAVAVWYICQACDLMWRPLGGCFTEPSSILFSPRGLENSSWTSKRNAFQASCLLPLSNRSSFFLFGCFVLSSTRWELLKSKFRPLIKEGKPLSTAL